MLKCRFQLQPRHRRDSEKHSSKLSHQINEPTNAFSVQETNAAPSLGLGDFGCCIVLEREQGDHCCGTCVVWPKTETRNWHWHLAPLYQLLAPAPPPTLDPPVAAAIRSFRIVYWNHSSTVVLHSLTTDAYINTFGHRCRHQFSQRIRALNGPHSLELSLQPPPAQES